MGRFLLGFIVGGAIGAAAVIALTPRSGAENRATIGSRINAAMDRGRRAMTEREQELWNDFRQRMQEQTGGNGLQPYDAGQTAPYANL